MKRILVVLAMLLSAPFCYADLPEFEVKIDTVVMCNEQRFYVKQIGREEFLKLHKQYAKTPSKPVGDIVKVQKMLGQNFEIEYMQYSEESDAVMISFRNSTKFKILICESDGFTRYYPQERIIMYYGGHQSDHAFFIDTGEEAYNPYYSAITNDKQFRFKGLHDGQDSVPYKLEIYNPQAQTYTPLCSLQQIWDLIPNSNEVMGSVNYVYEQFWVGHTLYFRVGYDDGSNDYSNLNYVSIKMPK